MFEDASLQCPYCFETFQVPVDPGAGRSQDWVYDCEVCCRPIEVHVGWNSETEEYEATAERSQ